MVLSPIDIEQKTFRVALRGYSEEEVDQFLDEIVIAVREYERQLRDANERVAVLEEQLEANRETEERIRKTLVIAQRTADQVVDEARGEAQQLLSEARSKVSEVEREQIQEREDLIADLDRMRVSVAGLKERIIGLADSTMGNLEAIEDDIVASQPETEEGLAFEETGEPEYESPVDPEEPDDAWDEESESVGDEADDDNAQDDNSDYEGPDGGEEDDQSEESGGQVYLGSTQRPWERGDAEG